MEKHYERTRQTTADIYDTPGEYDYPKKEEETIRNVCKCGHHIHYDSNNTWSLQDAVASALGQFLDKSETVNKWTRGLDL